MAYKMRFRVAIKGVGPGAAEEAEAADTVLVSVGDYAEPPTSKVLSQNAAVSLGMSFLRRFQSGAYINARCEIYGQPVGAPEPGNEDLSAESKEERLYAHIDTPNPRLVFELARANRKTTAVSIFEPAEDVVPEVEELA